jgi:diacylglycerol kinase family enzyme
MSRIPAYLKGKAYDDTKNFIHRRVKKVEIKSNRRLLVVIDGETFADTEVTFELAPHALRFVAPEGMDFKRGVPRT